MSSRMVKIIRSRYCKLKTPEGWRDLTQEVRQSLSLTESERDLLTPECEAGLWRIVARAKSGEDWLALLNAIPDEQLRSKAASIIWWDFGSEIKALWPLVLSYNFRLKDNPEALYGTLRTLGYPEKLARRRCIMPKTQYTPITRAPLPLLAQTPRKVYLDMDQASVAL